MKKEDYIFTYRYLNSYGNKVVVAIKNRIRQDKLIDTGALLNSIDYQINDKNNKFQVIFTIGDGNFRYGSGLPSEYGVYQDQGTIFIEPHYFFTAPIPGLTQADFLRDLTVAMKKDVENYVQKQIRKELKEMMKK